VHNSSLNCEFNAYQNISVNTARIFPTFLSFKQKTGITKLSVTYDICGSRRLTDDRRPDRRPLQPLQKDVTKTGAKRRAGGKGIFGPRDSLLPLLQGEACAKPE
jgi:hypothetical protein